MRKTEMCRLIEVLESRPARELRKASKSALATSLESRFAFGPGKSKNADRKKAWQNFEAGHCERMS
jgi:hypothetical protein